MAHFDSNIRFTQSEPSARRTAGASKSGAKTASHASVSSGRRPRARRSATPGIAPGSAQGSGLASARDRQRLRQRNAEERARVEAVLAAVPAPLERLAPPTSRVARERNQPCLRAVEPATCPVCRQAKIVTDEVMHAGTLRISECLHCEYRWTERPRSRWSEVATAMSASAAMPEGQRAPSAASATPRLRSVSGRS